MTARTWKFAAIALVLTATAACQNNETEKGNNQAAETGDNGIYDPDFKGNNLEAETEANGIYDPDLKGNNLAAETGDNGSVTATNTSTPPDNGTTPSR